MEWVGRDFSMVGFILKINIIDILVYFNVYIGRNIDIYIYMYIWVVIVFCLDYLFLEEEEEFVRIIKFIGFVRVFYKII